MSRLSALAGGRRLYESFAVGKLTAWARSFAPVFAKTWLMCDFTVAGLTKSVRAMSRFESLFRDQTQHFGLADGETVGQLRRGAAASTRSCEQRFVCGGVEHGLARGGRLERTCDLDAAGVLGEKASGARRERLEDGRVVGMRGEDDDLDVGMLSLDASGRFDAVAAWHAQVHQHDVGVGVP